MHVLKDWVARRSGAGITVKTKSGEKQSLDVITVENGKVIGRSYLPRSVDGNSELATVVDVEVELAV